MVPINNGEKEKSPVPVIKKVYLFFLKVLDWIARGAEKAAEKKDFCRT